MPVEVRVSCDHKGCVFIGRLDEYNHGERPPGWLFRVVEHRTYSIVEGKYMVKSRRVEQSFCPEHAELYMVQS